MRLNRAANRANWSNSCQEISIPQCALGGGGEGMCGVYGAGGMGMCGGYGVGDVCGGGACVVAMVAMVAMRDRD